MHKHGLLQTSVPSWCSAVLPLALLRTPAINLIGDEEYLETGLPKLSFDEDKDSGSDFAPDKLPENVPQDLHNDSEDLEVDEEEAPKRGKNQTPIYYYCRVQAYIASTFDNGSKTVP
ncbi:hypothetical protein F4604DRAFT_1672859 [Suillus subluteus]|nr:hypothetical protein F4604DRAFT_1672859 [Suillus subluteus]